MVSRQNDLTKVGFHGWHRLTRCRGSHFTTSLGLRLHGVSLRLHVTVHFISWKRLAFCEFFYASLYVFVLVFYQKRLLRSAILEPWDCPGQFCEQSVLTQAESWPEMAPPKHSPPWKLGTFASFSKDACFLAYLPGCQKLRDKQSSLLRCQLFHYFWCKCTCSNAVWTYSLLHFVKRVPFSSQIPTHYPHLCPWTLSRRHYSIMVISLILRVNIQ